MPIQFNSAFVPPPASSFAIRNTPTAQPATISAVTPDIVFNSFSGVDIVAELILPNEAPLIVGELQTVSYSMHRENVPVRHLGHVSPSGFVKGPRTIAGSLIFTVFNAYFFYQLSRMQTATSYGLFPLADMLPPFDIVLSFANEYGVISKMRICGVTIIDEGQTMSVDDLIVEQVYSYMARGIYPLISKAMDDQRIANAITIATIPPPVTRFV